MLIFSNFMIEIKSKSQKNPIYNFCAKFRQILDICKHYSGYLVNAGSNSKCKNRGILDTKFEKPVFLGVEVELFWVCC